MGLPFTFLNTVAGGGAGAEHRSVEGRDRNIRPTEIHNFVHISSKNRYLLSVTHSL